MTSQQLEQFAQQDAPMINLFPYAQNGDPTYDPCSVEWYLTYVDFVNDETTDPPPIAESQLKDAKGYLLIPDPTASSTIRSGFLPSAAAYVHVMQTPDTSGSGATYDLQYWFFTSRVDGRRRRTMGHEPESHDHCR